MKAIQCALAGLCCLLCWPLQANVVISLDCRPGGAWTQQIRNRDSGETWFFDGEFEQVEPERLV